MQHEGQIPPLSNWNDYKLLLTVAEAGALRGAARKLAISRNTLKAHLDDMEKQLNGSLMTADFRGVKLTSLGLGVVERARRIRELIDPA
ncbi:MAG: LysR family transcriptional regulator [Pacificimonas sp.]